MTEENKQDGGPKFLDSQGVEIRLGYFVRYQDGDNESHTFMVDELSVREDDEHPTMNGPWVKGHKVEARKLAARPENLSIVEAPSEDAIFARLTRPEVYFHLDNAVRAYEHFVGAPLPIKNFTGWRIEQVFTYCQAISTRFTYLKWMAGAKKIEDAAERDSELEFGDRMAKSNAALWEQYDLVVASMKDELEASKEEA